MLKESKLHAMPKGRDISMRLAVIGTRGAGGADTIK
jgi:hypothetical protein